jgi:hypothetical protein
MQGNVVNRRRIAAARRRLRDDAGVRGRLLRRRRAACFAIGEGGGQACSVTAATAGATFSATTEPLALGAHTTTVPQCAPVTIAVTLAGGRVAALRDDWC